MFKPSMSSGSAIRLENEYLTVSVLPDIGAKIFDLIDRRTGWNYLWHNPRIRPQSYPVDANFDNYWCGGWDDGFPTCEACTHSGEIYPNLGELRSVRWDAVRGSGLEPSVTLSAFGPISPVSARKTVRLRGASVESEFSVTHEGHLPIDFIWGTHPAYQIEPGCVIHVPAKTGIVGQVSDPSFGEPGQRYDWPLVKTPAGSRDMSRVPAPGALSAGHYAAELSDGWYALEYPERGIGLLFEFPLDLCLYLWMWLSYGGWRGYYLAVIEPWTSCPVTLSDAVAAKTHRVLSPGETFSATVRATLWSAPETLQNLLARRTKE